MQQINADELLKTALAAHQAGQLQQAEQMYRQILAADEKNAPAWHLLGVLAHQVGRPVDAEQEWHGSAAARWTGARGRNLTTAEGESAQLRRVSGEPRRGAGRRGVARRSHRRGEQSVRDVAAPLRRLELPRRRLH